jgi:hypothetical protein
MAVRSGPLIGVVVVVPTFAVTPQRDEPIVRAVVAGFVIAVSEYVCQ